MNLELIEMFLDLTIMQEITKLQKSAIALQDKQKDALIGLAAKGTSGMSEEVLGECKLLSAKVNSLCETAKLVNATEDWGY